MLIRWGYTVIVVLGAALATRVEIEIETQATAAHSDEIYDSADHIRDPEEADAQKFALQLLHEKIQQRLASRRKFRRRMRRCFFAAHILAALGTIAGLICIVLFALH